MEGRDISKGAFIVQGGFTVVAMRQSGDSAPIALLRSESGLEYSAVLDPDDARILILEAPDGEDLAGTPFAAQAQAAITEELRDRAASAEYRRPEGRGSLRTAQPNVSLHRNARVRRMVGVAHASPADVYFSSANTNTFAYLEIQNDPLTENPRAVDEHIRYARSLGEERDALVVVAGDIGWMREWLRSLREPDFVAFVGSEPVLEELGVEVIDRGFAGGEQRTLDDFLYPAYHMREDPSPSSTKGEPYSSQTVPRQMRPERTRLMPEQRFTSQNGDAEREEPGQGRGTSLEPAMERREPPAPAPRARTDRPQSVRRQAENAPRPGAPPPEVQAMGVPIGPIVGSTDPGVDVPDEEIAAAAMRFLASGQGGESEPEPAPVRGGIAPGMRVIETATSVRGQVLQIVGSVAEVRFDDTPEPQEVPLSELEPSR